MFSFLFRFVFLYLEHFGEKAAADLLLMKIVEAMKGGDGMLDCLTGAARLEAIGSRSWRLAELVVGTEEFLVVDGLWIARCVVDGRDSRIRLDFIAINWVHY